MSLSPRAQSGAFPIIDSHVHIWKHDPKYPWAKETTHPPRQDATPEMLLELMRANAVDRTVLVQVIHYRWDNSYLADALKSYPERFRGVARVNPEDPAAPDHVSALAGQQGFTGIRIATPADARGDWIRGPLVDSLWARCRDLNLSISVLAPIERVPDVARVIDRFQDVDVVIDHMADCPPDRPESLKHLLALKRYPCVSVKVSHTWAISRQPYPYPDSQAQVKRLYDAFGPKRLMWGSDWPLVEAYCGYARALKMVRDEMPFLNAEDKRWMLSKNIQRIFRF
jgi:predicted TIM-barrel fold metal-dependent hydrolase